MEPYANTERAARAREHLKKKKKVANEIVKNSRKYAPFILNSCM